MKIEQRREGIYILESGTEVNIKIFLKKCGSNMYVEKMLERDHAMYFSYDTFFLYSTHPEEVERVLSGLEKENEDKSICEAIVTEAYANFMQQENIQGIRPDNIESIEITIPY